MGQLRLGSTYVGDPYQLSSLCSSGAPVIIPSNGTIATNGTVTLVTALPTTYSGGAWVYFPATAFAGTGVAGLYWTVMSSTTVGVVYQNIVLQTENFEPNVPSVLLGAVTGSNTSYTQTINSDFYIFRGTVPGGLMGKFGQVSYKVLFATNATANSKPVKINFNSTAIHTSSLSSNAAVIIDKETTCRGTPYQQVSNPLAALGHGAIASGSPLYLSVDTTADFDITVTGQLSTATDYIVMEYLNIIIAGG